MRRGASFSEPVRISVGNSDTILNSCYQSSCAIGSPHFRTSAVKAAVLTQPAFKETSNNSSPLFEKLCWFYCTFISLSSILTIFISLVNTQIYSKIFQETSKRFFSTLVFTSRKKFFKREKHNIYYFFFYYRHR